jgi:hypothetical protein
MAALMDERELLRKAKRHRLHRGRWDDFWAEHDVEIRSAFPNVNTRRRLVDALQLIILVGVGPPVEALR